MSHILTQIILHPHTEQPPNPAFSCVLVFPAAEGAHVGGTPYTFQDDGKWYAEDDSSIAVPPFFWIDEEELCAPVEHLTPKPLSMFSQLVAMPAPKPLTTRAPTPGNANLALATAARKAHSDDVVKQLFELHMVLTPKQVQRSSNLSYKGARAALERAAAAGTALLKRDGSKVHFYRRDS